MIRTYFRETKEKIKLSYDEPLKRKKSKQNESVISSNNVHEDTDKEESDRSRRKRVDSSSTNL